MNSIPPEFSCACFEEIAKGYTEEQAGKKAARCLKCFGCRDICPMYYCKECALEHPDLMSTGMVPPDSVFHLVRAIHMAGRCIDCGLCEENCPADIPLRVLYKKGNALVQALFDYETGSLETGHSPWKYLGEEVTLAPTPM